jgi:hypothetical protein
MLCTDKQTDDITDAVRGSGRQEACGLWPLKRSLNGATLMVGGAITWEPLTNLIDEEDDGTTTATDPLKLYWDNHQDLRELAEL